MILINSLPVTTPFACDFESSSSHWEMESLNLGCCSGSDQWSAVEARLCLF